MSRCDLQVHSRYSARSEEWLFRRFDFPDSFTDPAEIHARLKERGMDFVTITDHDSIEGCLRLEEHPDTFLSEQITTFFPQDPCKINLLAWGITEGQHNEIARLRENIFDLQGYLQTEGIVHAVAHPLYSINGKLEAAHLEKLILLFKHFEGLNGLRDALLSEIARDLLGGLTEKKIEEMANRHGFAPTHPEPWRKIFTAGSDDHGGVFLASAFTETAGPATRPADFLAAVQRGDCEIRGEGGTPVALAHGFYKTLSLFIEARFTSQMGPGANLVSQMFSRFMEGRDPTEFSLREKASFVAEGILSGKLFELAKPANVSLWKELSGYFARVETKRMLAREVKAIPEQERRAFLMANLVSEQFAFRLFEKFIIQIRSGNLLEAIQALSGVVPILVILAPYIYGFHSQAPSRRWLREICTALSGKIPASLQNHKRAWFTDTLDDVNGVATTIRKMTAEGAAAGETLVVVTSRKEIGITDIPLKNFRPIGEFELPEYELQKLSFPPILQILDYVQREGFTEIIISTPGPVGLTGALAARMLNLRSSGIYHTDFPEYIRILTEDSFLESLAWTYMRWFYGQFDIVYVNSEQYRRSWVQRGFAPEKLKILPRGIDTELFHPDRRDPGFWKKAPGIRLLYVGRISREKDLAILAEAFEKLQAGGLEATLLFVGDGPFRQELSQQLPGAIFTGYLTGDKLATAYASADIFVFPSTTDTFGNVILEAQASGLPAVVSDLGGPKELVENGVDGLVTKAHDADDFARAIRTLAEDPARRREMAARARQKVVDRSWPNAFRAFWATTAG